MYGPEGHFLAQTPVPIPHCEPFEIVGNGDQSKVSAGGHYPSFGNDMVEAPCRLPNGWSTSA